MYKVEERLKNIEKQLETLLEEVRSLINGEKVRDRKFESYKVLIDRLIDATSFRYGIHDGKIYLATRDFVLELRDVDECYYTYFRSKLGIESKYCADYKGFMEELHRDCTKRRCNVYVEEAMSLYREYGGCKTHLLEDILDNVCDVEVIESGHNSCIEGCFTYIYITSEHCRLVLG